MLSILHADNIKTLWKTITNLLNRTKFAKYVQKLLYHILLLKEARIEC